MKKKGWLSLSLAIALTAALLSACGGNKNGGDSSPSASPSESAASSSSESPASEAPMKLTFWDLDGTAVKNSPGITALQQKLNIEVDYISTTREAMKEKLNLMLASNDIPDWWKEPSFPDYDKLLQQSVAAEIPQELIEQNMPKYVAWLKRYLGDDPFQYVRRDGKIYALPVIWDIGIDGVQLGFREDWLKKVGITKTPETLEEMEEALTKFRNDDPDGNNKKDTYGITSSGDNIESMMSSVFGAFDAYPNIFREKDGKIVRGEIEPGAKQALEVLTAGTRTS